MKRYGTLTFEVVHVINFHMLLYRIENIYLKSNIKRAFQLGRINSFCLIARSQMLKITINFKFQV